MTPFSKLFCFFVVCITLFAAVSGGQAPAPAPNTAELDSLKAQVSKLQQDLTASTNKEKDLQTRLDDALKKLKDKENALTSANTKIDDLNAKIRKVENDTCANLLTTLYVWKAIALKQAEELSTHAEQFSNQATDLYHKNLHPHVGEALGVTAEYVDKTLGTTGDYVDQALGVTSEFVDQALVAAEKFYDQNAPPEAKKIVNDYRPHYEHYRSHARRIYDQVHEKVSTHIWPFKYFARFRRLGASLFLLVLPIAFLLTCFKCCRTAKKPRRPATITTTTAATTTTNTTPTPTKKAQKNKS